jgi:hypothetical protein
MRGQVNECHGVDGVEVVSKGGWRTSPLIAGVRIAWFGISKQLESGMGEAAGKPGNEAE